jgi:putative peptidoglycan lipid II flippase
VKGLALGNTIAYTFAALVAAAILRRRVGGLNGAVIVRGLGLVAVASGATGAAAYAVSHAVGHAVSTSAVPGQLLQVGAAVGTGLVVFLAVARLLRIEDLEVLKGLLPARFRR